jgi:hypothetical protein
MGSYTQGGDMNYRMYYKPVTIVVSTVICIFISMFICALLTTLQPRDYAKEYHTFLQPDGTIIQLKIYGVNLNIIAETPEGILVVRDSHTDWICYAVLNKNRDTYISSGIPYLPNMNNNQEAMDTTRARLFTHNTIFHSLNPITNRN